MLGSRQLEHFLIDGCLLPEVAQVHCVMPSFAQPRCDLWREGIVDKESHGAGANGISRSRTASAA